MNDYRLKTCIDGYKLLQYISDFRLRIRTKNIELKNTSMTMD